MRISLIAWIVLAYAALTHPLNGQTSSEPANAARVTIIRAARFLDVTDGKIVPNVSVAVKDGKILSVSAGLTIPGATVIDLGDMTILPGLIDVHTHLTFDAQTDWVHLPVEETAVDAALRGVRAARSTLLAGFTTVRDLGNGVKGFVDVSMGSLPIRIQ